MTNWLVLYCLLNNEKKAGHIISLLKPEFFSEELARKIFLYIRELMQKGLNPDLSLVKTKFISEKEAIQSHMEEAQTDVDSYEEVVSLLREQYVKREIKAFGYNISSADMSEETFTKKTEDIITAISTTSKENLHFAPELFDRVIQIANSEEEYTSPVKYWIESLDEHTGGLYAGDSVVIAGRPSMGKSGLMCHIAIHNAMNGFVTIFFSLEMSKEKLGERFICNACDLELWKIKTVKRRSEKEQKHFMQTAAALKETPLIVETTAVLDVNNIRSVIQEIQLKFGRVDLVIIDYLQLMSGEGANDNSRVSAISRNLKSIAMQYKIPVVVGSQLSRTCEQRDDKRPILGDLRDSGAIEQDADLVFMLYRDAYYTTNPEHERILEILIRKFRNGEVKKIIVDYNLKKQTIKSMNWNGRLGQVAKKFEYV